MSNKKNLPTTLPAISQLQNFIDGIAGSVYWKDRNGVYLGCNETFIKKGNLASKKDIIGKTDFDVWPSSAPSLVESDTRVMEYNQAIEKEETVVLRNGERLHFSSMKSPLKDEDGNIIGVIGNSLDITELKEAKQNAEAASQAKTQFLALMSHELRLPLTGILSTANLLTETEDMSIEEMRDLIKIIEQSGLYLLSTIDSILNFAQLESKKFKLALAPVNLKMLIEEIGNILSVSAKEKNLDMQMNFDSTIPPLIVSDFRVLRHIIINLLSNAIRYTDSGKIILTVALISKSASSVRLKISVEDTGIGIPPEKMKFIFDKFSQVETGYVRKKSRGGTGLGLSIVKNLVELLDSQILLTSTLDVGSNFFFTANFSLPKRSKKTC